MIPLVVALDAILLTRLYYLLSDAPIGLPRIAVLAAAQLGLLFLLCTAGAPSIAVAGVILIASAIDVVSERLGREPGSARLSSLLVLVLGSSLSHALAGPLEARAWLTTAPGPLPLLPDESELGTASLFLFGLLLLANETNLLVRAAFHHLRLEPGRVTARDDGEPEIEVDEAEYRAGRVIGILERWLMFAVVVSGADLSALAFIIAAKGLARLKQLEEQRFAEYMLIGTFLSAFSAIAVAYWIDALR
jgi:hypothetical protein